MSAGRSPAATGLRPLDGIRVLALEHAASAPFATRQLADLGAEVVKIERPGVGDFARTYDTSVHGLSAYFVWLNRSKKSVTLDLKHPAAREVLDRLVERSDVLVQNLAPGATARLGLDFEALHERHPRLIVCDVTGYGDGGPARDRKAYDLLVQSEAGLLSVTGTSEEPCKVGISIADIATGMYAFTGVLTALLLRGRTGRGSHVPISMLESLAEWMAHPLYYAHYSGSAPPRNGASHATIAPYGAFRAGDGELLMLGLQNEREWRVFCEQVLCDPEVAGDPRFGSNVARNANRAALTGRIEAAFAGLTRAQVLEKLDAARIANARLNGMQALWDHEQLAARDRWRTVETEAGDIQALLPPATLAGTDAVMDPVPALGAHTGEVLAAIGYHEAEIAELRRAGAV